MAKAAQRRPRFNATEYKEDFLDLIKTNPDLAADSAKRLASRKVKAENQVQDADSATRDLFGFLIALVITGVAGWWNGSMRAKRDALVDDWELEGAEAVGAAVADAPYPWAHERGVGDPTKWYFVPKLIVVPLGAGLMAVIASAMRKKAQAPGFFERGMTMTAAMTFGLTVASISGGLSYERKEKRYAKDGVNSVSNGAANGGAIAPAA